MKETYWNVDRKKKQCNAESCKIVFPIWIGKQSEQAPSREQDKQFVLQQSSANHPFVSKYDNEDM